MTSHIKQEETVAMQKMKTDYVLDLWLDTFPMHQGESMSEYSSKGGVFLRLLDQPNVANFMVEKEGIENKCRDWACDVDDYIEVADYLINNPECMTKLGNENISNALYVVKARIQTGIKEFIDILGKL